jgi:hypothetical protein
VLTEEDQRSVLIIGGIHIFLPRIPVEARACVAYAAVEGQPMQTLIKENKEKTLEYSPAEGEEHLAEFLRNFI